MKYYMMKEKKRFQKALDLLPEIQREVVILRYYHDLKVKILRQLLA